MRFWHALPFMAPAEAIELAVASDEAGYHGIMVPDHLFYPRALASPYPYSEDGAPSFQPDDPWPDPWVLIGAMAARTTAIRFTTNIYIAPLRDLFTVAKAVSTAAVVSGGRVALGAGAGWMREEFEQTGQDFGSRGKRLNEMIGVLRKLWTGDWVSHHGEHYDFGELKIAPVPDEPIPIYVGGHSPPALRRAATLADGWIGVLYKVGEAEETARSLRERVEAAGRATDGFEIILAVYAMPDVTLCERLEAAGVTGLICAPWMMTGPSLAERVEETRRFGSEVLAKL